MGGRSLHQALQRRKDPRSHQVFKRKPLEPAPWAKTASRSSTSRSRRSHRTPPARTAVREDMTSGDAAADPTGKGKGPALSRHQSTARSQSSGSGSSREDTRMPSPRASASGVGSSNLQAIIRRPASQRSPPMASTSHGSGPSVPTSAGRASRPSDGIEKARCRSW